MLTDKEQLIIKEIEVNPFIKQEELAAKLSLSRIAIAAHISNLTKKGFIAGRGYYIKYPSMVSIVGGISLAFLGHSNQEFKDSDNNLGLFETSIRGTAYNIFKNLSDWDNEINYISFTGDDSYGNEIAILLKNNKVDNIELIKVSGAKTSLYVSFYNNNSSIIGTMLSMQLFNDLSLKDFKNILPKLQNTYILYIDSNYPVSIINELANLNKDAYVIYNTITSRKTYNYKELRFKANFIATSLSEMSVMFGQTFTDDALAIKFLEGKGFNNGLIYGNDLLSVFCNGLSWSQEVRESREYYISKLIFLKKHGKSILQEGFENDKTNFFDD